MDIEKAKKVLEELKENKYGELLNCYDQGEEAEIAIETVLNELDKDNNIISDLQNEVTLKQCELDKKEKIINNAKQWIENTMNDRHIVGCNLGDLQMLLDILESE